MPKSLLQEVIYRNATIDEVIESFDGSYTGTDPVEDSAQIFKESKKKNLRNYHEAKDIDEVKDPFEIYGYAILSYFTLLRSLMGIFALMTALNIPLIIYYSQGKFMKQTTGTWGLYTVSLGNIGQTEPQCIHQYVGLTKEQSFKCNKGRLSELYYYGVIPVRQDEDSFSLDHCGPKENHQEVLDCTNSYLDADRI